MTVRRVARLAAGVVVLIALAGCGGSSRPPSRAPSAPPAVAHRTPASSRPVESGARQVRVLSWGVDDGLLSVLLRNTSGGLIRSARAIITAKDAAGTMVATVSGPATDRCCTLLGVPRGARFGVYASVGAAAARIRAVTVTLAYADIVRGSAPPVTAAGPRLVATSPVAVVDAVLTGRPGAGPHVAAQALLTDAAGHFRAVVSGRFYCLRPGTPLHVRMQFFHPVPPDTRVRQVIAYSVPDGLAAQTLGLPSCV